MPTTVIDTPVGDYAGIPVKFVDSNSTGVATSPPADRDGCANNCGLWAGSADAGLDLLTALPPRRGQVAPT